MQLPSVDENDIFVKKSDCSYHIEMGFLQYSSCVGWDQINEKPNVHIHHIRMPFLQYASSCVGWEEIFEMKNIRIHRIGMAFL